LAFLPLFILNKNILGLGAPQQPDAFCDAFWEIKYGPYVFIEVTIGCRTANKTIRYIQKVGKILVKRVSLLFKIFSLLVLV
jgi:hypothetical protein